MMEVFNPADYFTFVLDQEIRAAGMAGGYCGLVLQLSKQPNLNQLQQHLDLLVEKFPKVSAKIEQHGKRYYWVKTHEPIVLEQHTRIDVVDIFNRHETRPLAVHWITSDLGGQLLLVWNHPLLDARGAKIVLDFLTSDNPDKFKESDSLISAKLAGWSWWKKLTLLFKAKRHNHQANSVDSCLPTTTEHGSQILKLKVQRFDKEQSKQIAQLAQQHTGLAGRTLYYLGCFMRAMEQVGAPHNKAGYCIPYAFNLRRPNAPTPVLGNHVGCLFARATREQVQQDRASFFSYLLNQHTQAVRDELDLAYLPLMWLGQWLTPARYAQFLRKQHSGNELSSLWFSDLGDLSWKNGFLGVPVVGISMMCWTTLPPALALLVGQLDGQLTLSFSYLSPAVDEAWLDEVIARMDAELLCC